MYGTCLCRRDSVNKQGLLYRGRIETPRWGLHMQAQWPACKGMQIGQLLRLNVSQDRGAGVAQSA